MKAYVNVSVEKASNTILRQLFFQESIFVRKGFERNLAECCTNYTGETTLSSTEVKALKTEGFFSEDARVNETPLEYFNLGDIQSEFVKTLLESKRKVGYQMFVNQDEIELIYEDLVYAGLTEKNLRFLEINSSEKFYLKHDSIECTKHCLRDFFDMIPAVRQEELRNIVRI